MSTAGTGGNALVVFCKFPTPGKVKTRLASTVGAEKAAAVYRAMAEDCIREMLTLRPDVDVTISYDPPHALGDMRTWLGPACRYEPQLGGDLGSRMLYAFQAARRRGAARVVVIGTDCPDLRAGYVLKAFDLLAGNDLVLGPAVDGGYYLIGVRKPEPKMFEGIPWSTDAVMARTREAAHAAGLSWTEMEFLRDVDTEDDLPLNS